MILKIEIYQTLSSGIKLGYKQVFVLWMLLHWRMIYIKFEFLDCLQPYCIRNYLYKRFLETVSETMICIICCHAVGLSQKPSTTLWYCRFLRSRWVWLGPDLSAAPHHLHRWRRHHSSSQRNHTQTGGILFVCLCPCMSQMLDNNTTAPCSFFFRRPTAVT